MRLRDAADVEGLINLLDQLTCRLRANSFRRSGDNLIRQRKCKSLKKTAALCIRNTPSAWVIHVPEDSVTDEERGQRLRKIEDAKISVKTQQNDIIYFRKNSKTKSRTLHKIYDKTVPRNFFFICLMPISIYLFLTRKLKNWWNDSYKIRWIYLLVSAVSDKLTAGHAKVQHIGLS